MSSSIRQSNLFAASDYQKVFQAYQFIDYTAYDYDTLKQALINYIQTYYPEDFNDYIESSEFIAIVELLAYLGTSIAFRTDLNSRENFIDTATRRESIIRLAQMVNYVPRRNVPASGLMKISSVTTDQVLTDSNGINLSNLTVFWNDPNNINWFDQFIQICNAAFSSLNPFGRPTKSGTIGSIPTDLYALNNILNLNVTYPVSITINGQSYPIDICNPNLITNQTIFENDPDPANAFNFIYRNDSLGVSSANTGFFLYFKQGNLINIDNNFTYPVPNRQWAIDIQNINQSDVYVQETDQNGNVLNKWSQVPALSGENIIYNSIQSGIRNVFDVISGPNDTITIRFADGNFGNVPSGLFRAWVRISANQDLIIHASDAQGLQITIPYIGVDQQQYNLTVTFNLEQTISNAASSETNDQIRLRAPEVFSTQSRMVNGSDYNVLPLIYGNQIAKVQAINRTFSGMSRYIDLNDPTGYHKDLVIFGEDGVIYRDDANILTQIVEDASNTNNINTVIIETIQSTLADPKMTRFFYDAYLPQFESTVRVNPPNTGRSLLDLVPTGSDTSTPLFWSTSPATFKNTTGYFTISSSPNGTPVSLTNSLDSANISGGLYEAFGFIKTGSILQLAKDSITQAGFNTTAVNSVIQDGLPVITNSSNPYLDLGSVELSQNEQNGFQALKVYPPFRATLTTAEISEITASINGGISFYIYYDLLTDEWHCSTTATAGIADQSMQAFIYPSPQIISGQEQIYSNWTQSSAGGLIYINISNNTFAGTTTYNITGRGRIYVFESLKDVRFYWEPNQVIIDNTTGQALKDNIEVMPMVNTNYLIDNNFPTITSPTTSYLTSGVSFNPSGVFIQQDGYTDQSKIQISLVDNNNDGIPDDPTGFDQIVSPDQRVVFEYYVDGITGYQSTRPWISYWATNMKSVNTDLYLYFPVANPTLGTDTTLYSSPFISNVQFDPATQYEYILNPGLYSSPGYEFVIIDGNDLIFINQLSQMSFDPVTSYTVTLANQISAFYNNSSVFPWIVGTTNITDKANIVSTYFINKSFLLYANSTPGYGVYYGFETATTSNLQVYPSGQIIQEVLDTTHFDKNGKSFTQNSSISSTEQLPFYFKWNHYSPLDQRVDPAASNITDMIVITNGYYNDMVNWKNNNGTLATQPSAPTSEDLRVQFQDLDQYKMISDNMIWNSGTFKLLFGTQADLSLQATFVVVKSLSTTMSDNEIKTQVIQSVDAYFDIRNWDFGETFYYTELAAFVHQQLSQIISTVVIVPASGNSQFGNLFQIVAGPTELFMSTATVGNVQIVSALTAQNIRI